MNNDFRKAIVTIGEFYGYNHQRKKLIEEMAELTVEICHLDERGNYENHRDRARVYEELADVEVVLEQIKYLLNCEDEVEALKMYKVRRQLDRIEGEKNGC